MRYVWCKLSCKRFLLIRFLPFTSPSLTPHVFISFLLLLLLLLCISLPPKSTSQWQMFFSLCLSFPFVMQIKILGSLALVDEGETDWKIIAMLTSDLRANTVHSECRSPSLFLMFTYILSCCFGFLFVVVVVYMLLHKE